MWNVNGNISIERGIINLILDTPPSILKNKKQPTSLLQVARRDLKRTYKFKNIFHFKKSKIISVFLKTEYSPKWKSLKIQMKVCSLYFFLPTTQPQKSKTIILV